MREFDKKKKERIFFFVEKKENTRKKMVHDSTMNPQKHISEEIRDQNVSIFFKIFFYFVCETLLLIIEKNDEIVKINF